MNQDYTSCVEFAQLVKDEIRESVERDIFSIKKKRLAIIQVGDNQASNAYIKGKLKDIEEVGFSSMLIKLSNNMSESEAVTQLDKIISPLNMNSDIDGIIVQLPIELSNGVVLKYNPKIFNSKDVDGFNASSLFHPCTPLGIIEYLRYNNITLCGKHVVIIGRSEIVGKPLANMMAEKNATVTVCHSHTTNLSAITRTADIIVCAVGKRNMVTGDMVKDGVVVIDVGINRNEEGKLCGDCDYESLVDKCELITPVPNGVGRLTRAMLMKNVANAPLKK